MVQILSKNEFRGGFRGCSKNNEKNKLGWAPGDGQKIVKKWFGVDSPPPPDGCSRNDQSEGAAFGRSHTQQRRPSAAAALWAPL